MRGIFFKLQGGLLIKILFWHENVYDPLDLHSENVYIVYLVHSQYR